jgi:rhamnulokinase
VRFLKNLAGAWLIERCRPQWGDPSIADLIAAAATVGGPDRVLDVADHRFLNPDDMLAAVTVDLGLPADAPPPVVVRGIVESQAAGAAAVLDQLGGVTDVHVFGGAQSALYRRLLAERTGLPVCAGPVEATALGNALVQGIALGVYDDLADARRHLADPREPVR